MKDILLSQFNPVSELIVERHEVLKPRFPVIDFHAHYFESKDERVNSLNVKKTVEYLHDNGVAGIVNLICTTNEEEMYSIFNFAKEYPEIFIHFATVVDVTKIDEPGFADYVTYKIKETYKKGGIKGLKFLKDLSLKSKDKYGKYIRADDKRLRPIWQTAAELNIPVLIHIADPVAFFKPIDGRNERFEQLNEFPDWSFYREDLYKFEELMEMQENLLTDNPDTTFVLAHGGSYSENLGFVSKQLDAHPNMYIDISARIAEFGRQPYTARKFMIKHQDKILFGTDCSMGYTGLYPYYFRFLETWDEYIDYESGHIQGRWKIYGIGLPDEVLKKIYHENAVKLVPAFVKTLEAYKSKK